jgi:ribonuclease VapC
VSETILDASALLAVAKEERGGERVLEIIRRGATINAVNLAEVAAKLADEAETFEEVAERLQAFAFDVVAFDHQQALVAGELRRRTRHLGLSLGDRACLAMALVRAGHVVTADRAWAEFDLGVAIEVIR